MTKNITHLSAGELGNWQINKDFRLLFNAVRKSCSGGNAEDSVKIVMNTIYAPQSLRFQEFDKC